MPGCTALLLSVLAVTLSWPAVGPTKFTVSVEQDVYQAEEKSNITMTWLFHFNPNRPPGVLEIDLMNEKRKTRIFSYDSRNDNEMYPDEFYMGRLQCDAQLAWKGQFKCLLTDLRLSDTGTYDCFAVFNSESSSVPCDLNVTAAIEKPAGETKSEPASRGRIGLYASLGLFVVAIITLSLRYFSLNVCCK